MIKINKFKNIYGITNLIGANNLLKNSVIYAPNGTAKSSISDALQAIGDGDDLSSISDVYKYLPSPTFEIDVDGQLCTDTNRLSFKIVKYSGVNNYNLPDSENFSNIVISQNVMRQISASIAQIETAKNSIKTLIDGQFPSKYTSEEYKQSLSILAETTPNDPDLYLKLVQKVNLNTHPLPITVTEKMIIDLITDKVKETCNLPAVIGGANQYFNITNNTTLAAARPSFLDDEFTLEKLQDVQKNVKKNKFYKNTNPDRKLYIDGVAYDEVGVDSLISAEIARIYGTPQAKDAFDEISKAFKGSKKATNTLNSNPLLIPKLVNYNNMIAELFVTIIQPIIPQIQTLLTGIVTAQQNINTIRQTYNSNDNKFTEIWSKFESRFKFKKFELKIENEFNAVIGASMPTFIKYIPNTTTKITDPKALRFSTGEIKTFNLINFIIYVESLRLNNSPFTIILDDAVDSFDYKNKYGIIDYLCDIKDDPNIQLLVFTHNFDFYRSTIMAFGSNVGQYFAYRNSSNEINFCDTSRNQYLLSVVKFNAWKSRPSIAQYYALIPFSRNVLQLSSNAHNTIVQQIDDFIHYDPTNNKIINDVNAILNPHMLINMPNLLTGTELYLNTLNNLIEQIINGTIQVNETDLEYKIAMGLYIRIFLERYLFQNYYQNVGCFPTITDNTKRTRELIQMNQSGNYLTSEELRNVIEANVISPAYAHVNSFMYEPLIDVGISELLDSVIWIHDKNSRWPL